MSKSEVELKSKSMPWNQTSIINLTQFQSTIWAIGQHTVAIEQMENYDFVLKVANVNIARGTTDPGYRVYNLSYLSS